MNYSRIIHLIILKKTNHFEVFRFIDNFVSKKIYDLSLAASHILVFLIFSPVAELQHGNFGQCPT